MADACVSVVDSAQSLQCQSPVSSGSAAQIDAHCVLTHKQFAKSCSPSQRCHYVPSLETRDLWCKEAQEIGRTSIIDVNVVAMWFAEHKAQLVTGSAERQGALVNGTGGIELRSRKDSHGNQFA